MLEDRASTSRTERPPQGWSDLQKHLAVTRPSDLLVVSDMTGTLVTQTADSLLPKTRDAQRALFEKGMKLILATADSGHSVETFYLKPLGPVPSNALYVVHSVGAWRGVVREGELVPLSRGREISYEDRGALLAAMDRALGDTLKHRGAFFSKRVRAELLDTHARAPLKALSAEFGDQSFIEILPSKAAIFFLEQKIAGPTQQAVFDAYVEDLEVQRIIRNGYKMIRGGNYVDIFTCSKEEGVAAVMKNLAPISQKTLLVLGDSENDLGILRDPYEGFDRVLRVFLGQSQEVVSAMTGSAFHREFFQLRGAYCQGSAEIFAAIPT